jgi:hypothetical protein
LGPFRYRVADDEFAAEPADGANSVEFARPQTSLPASGRTWRGTAAPSRPTGQAVRSALAGLMLPIVDDELTATLEA